MRDTPSHYALSFCEVTDGRMDVQCINRTRGPRGLLPPSKNVNVYLWSSLVQI